MVISIDVLLFNVILLATEADSFWCIAAKKVLKLCDY